MKDLIKIGLGILAGVNILFAIIAAFAMRATIGIFILLLGANVFNFTNYPLFTWDITQPSIIMTPIYVYVIGLIALAISSFIALFSAYLMDEV